MNGMIPKPFEGWPRDLKYAKEVFVSYNSIKGVNMLFTRLSAALLGIILFLAPLSEAAAKDCGISPGKGPTIPSGATATSDEIGIAIRAIQDYSFEVQVYTTCMTQNKETFFLNMTEAQRERWAEDFNALADHLTKLETSLNEQLRIFNSRS